MSDNTTPAFPYTVVHETNQYGAPMRSKVFTGITQRQYFAAHAPEMPSDYEIDRKPSYPSDRNWNEGYYNDFVAPAQKRWESERRARWAFAYADAMIAASGE